MERAEAVDRIEQLLDTIDGEQLPVPVREVWVYGDVALGVDPVDRLDVYLTKDVLLDGDGGDGRFVEEHGVRGVGSTVRQEWAKRHPEHLRTNPNGYAAPEKCLAAHLLAEDEPVHLEVCNTGFEDNVTQRLRAAKARDTYEELLDPRGVCLWIDGTRGEDALEKLRRGELPFPPLSESLEMLGLGADEAERAAAAVHDWRTEQDGVTVRGDVV